MKPILRYQSQLLFRKSYKPSRNIRVRLATVSGGRPRGPSCSSKAEHSPDKRENAERYRAGRPAFAKATAGRPALDSLIRLGEPFP